VHVAVHITAGKQMREGLEGKLRELKIGIAGVFFRAASQYQSSVQARAPSDTGALRSGIKITKPTYKASTWGTKSGWISAKVRSTAPYSRAVEFGSIRKSTAARFRGRGARKLPPILPGSGLGSWAERKGINRWALQRAIGGAMKGRQGGSRGKHFWYPIASITPARIDPEMAALARRIFA
jgi:hypothetical protein